jgi:hypothetical protein
LKHLLLFGLIAHPEGHHAVKQNTVTFNILARHMFRKKALRILIFYYLLLLISKTILKGGRRGISFYDKKFIHFNYFTRRQKRKQGIH